MKKRALKISLLALATLPLLPILAYADTGPAPTAPTLTAAGVLQPHYPGLRIGDVAPMFAFPDLGDANGQLWQSRDRLGQNPLMVLVIGRGANGDVTRKLLSDEFTQAARQLKQKGVQPVVVVSAPALIKMEKVAESPFVALQDTNNTLSALLGLNADGVTLVAIDRAGFIRRIEPVAPELAPEMMRLIGDTTPDLEVGKPAPDFSISDMNGQVRRLSDLRGQKNLLLTFFPKCFTGG